MMLTFSSRKTSLGLFVAGSVWSNIETLRNSLLKGEVERYKGSMENKTEKKKMELGIIPFSSLSKS